MTDQREDSTEGCETYQRIERLFDGEWEDVTPQDSPEARIAALVQQIMSGPVRGYTGLGKGCYCEFETVDGQRYATWKCGDCAIRDALEAALHEQAREIERL